MDPFLAWAGKYLAKHLTAEFVFSEARSFVRGEPTKTGTLLGELKEEARLSAPPTERDREVLRGAHSTVRKTLRKFNISMNRTDGDAYFTWAQKSYRGVLLLPRGTSSAKVTKIGQALRTALVGVDQGISMSIYVAKGRNVAFDPNSPPKGWVSR